VPATKSVLIVGGSGFIGTHLAQRLRDDYKVFATYCKHPIQIPGVTCIPLTADNRNWVKRIVYMARPDVVVFAAGNNDVRWCEDNGREAERVHSAGAAMVATVADILQPKFIYLSNCYAFDGKRGNYHEADIILPHTELGKVKISGENFIKGRSLNYVFLRSSPVIGRGNGINLSILDKIRIKLSKGEKIDLPADELHSFAPVDGLLDLIERVIETGIRNKTLHYGGLTKITYYDLGVMIAEKFGFDPTLITMARDIHGQTNENMFDYSMNSTHTVETLKIKPFFLEECLDLIEKNLIPGL